MTSFSELARDGARSRTRNRAAPGEPAPRAAIVGAAAARRRAAPIVAATDYVRAVPEQHPRLPAAGRRYVTLGTDGFGRSDTRAALRRYFEVDAAAIVQAALRSLG